ncbi:TIGR02996 domain-containing protein [Tuwongella immobilis]|uniref:Repeat-companion domain protein n=1 Tax=Tuwongella immobilis TaxID=692036 RepID=A0A6C2YUP1_9BACT|nr:TIGR02996 domain-containing protein [Tuwongella immobilis]VIP04582.1 Uncharacterized protein OS=Nitrospina gracilis (strain 3/211) GN=NITGR_780018 PE=4 SV=1: LRR_1: LRR_6: LRR_6: LRR_6 [Tuwongella immobilis]VTS06525.1 Uncharacterized protein OS=Nitrospina gracilis (strain 3/211) GN=NITGR_780018 PE=4 SV=1: LRR_1: LRR_6: LRR_6: LRR_6 [Tuwongella immobilis]
MAFALSETEAAFQRAILIDADDWAARLAYADWLEEQQRSLESHVLRMELALQEYAFDDPRRTQLRSQLWELHRELDTLWIHRLPTLGGVVWGHVVHGVMNQVQISLGAQSRFPEGLFPFLPMMHLQLERIHPKQVRSIREHPALQSLVALTCDSSEVPLPVLMELLSSPFLVNLAVLRLPNLSLTNECTEILTRSPVLHGLQRLDLSRNHLTAISGELLGESPMMQQLRELSLYRNDFFDAGILSLVKSREFPQLTSLEVMNMHIGDRGAIALAESGIFRKLATINLCYNPIGDKGIAAFAECPDLNGKRLILRGNRIGDRGAMALIRSSVIDPTVTTLELGDHQMSETAQERLREHFGPRIYV